MRAVSSVRRLTAVAISFLFLFLSTGQPAAGEPNEPAPPSLLIVTLDTTRSDHIGCYGYGKGATPHLDSLASRGVQFLDAHTPVPLTLPAHATILTGLLPSSLNLRVNGLVLSGEHPTLATLLRDRGYSTGAVVSSVILDRTRGLNKGFETYIDKMTLIPRGGGPPEERRAVEVTDDALSIAEKMNKPFFLWVHYYDPHYDYRPPSPYKEKFQEVPYDGEIAYMDAEFGRLLEGLKRQGRLENTLIVVAGDHGESLGEYQERQHGVFIYEPTMHVPLWMVWDGHLPAGRKIQGICGLADLAPTVAGYLGFTLGTSDGSDLRPAVVSGETESRPQYMESYHGYFTYGWSPLRGVLSDRYKYIEAPHPELYEWRISEKENLFAKKLQTARTYEELLAEYPVADEGEKEAMEKLLTDPSNAETLRQLMSLGYVSGVHQSPNRPGLLDPKDVIGIEEEVRNAHDLLDMGQSDEGISKLKGILKRNPENVPALSMLGAAYLERGELERAKVCFQNEILLKPQMDTAHFHLGTVYKREGNFKGAEKEYLAALILNPRLPEASANLAKIYLETGRHGDALTLLNEALESGAESADLYFELGVAEAVRKNWERARWAFTKTLSLDPTRHEAMANMGRLAYQQGRIDESISHYERALKIAPRSVQYLATLGSIYLSDKDDLRKALRYYQRALSADPYGPEANNLSQLVRELQAQLNP